MATTATYALAINADGSVDTEYVAGNKPSGLDAPTGLTANNETQQTVDISWSYNGTGHDGFELEQWIQDVSTSWGLVYSAGAADRFRQVVALSPGQHVGHRIRAVDSVSGNVSEWSSEVWTNTLQSIPTGDTDISKLRWAPSLNGFAQNESLLGKLSAYWEGGACDHTKQLNGQSSSRQDLIYNQEGAQDGEEYSIGIAKWLSEGIKEGEEVWGRIWLWLEAGFSWEHGTAGVNANGRVKTLRVAQEKSKIDIQRCNSVYPDNDNVADGGFVSNHENTSDKGSGQWGKWLHDVTNSHDYQEETWECIEVYAKASASNSIGEWRFYRNGVQVGPTARQATLGTGRGDPMQLTDMMFWTHWNNGSPKAQTFWWCRPAVAVRTATRDDTVHMTTDATGHPIIGLAV